ncbi:MAG: D-glycero-beta-D-manno-heptose 1-phosphate adenylyltransferase [Planctomycetia bacterium]
MNATTTNPKILTADEAVVWVTAWRKVGLRVAFTNGCFDILHAGHLATLLTAKRSADRLVVGLNSDASVRRLKGPTRPIHEEADRAALLAALTCVDAVVVFDDDDPLDLIRRLRPDVLVKGGDYTAAAIIGRAEVESWGGRCLTADYLPGRSTTRAVGRLTAS